IAIGFCSNLIKLNNMPGFESGSWGYHSDDGEFFNCSIINKPYGPTFTTGDTIGCCLNFINKTVFYTKNGVNLGKYYLILNFIYLNGNLFPCIGLKGGSIKTNFGQKKFIYAGM
ncbi:concanavalin A-like lectin/glucanase domain-containing protein, partial [Gigaspora rosea]